MFVVFDLDGTIANHNHRLHFVSGDNRDWESFFAGCVDDKPNSYVIATLNAHLGSGHRIEIWSGRSAVVEIQTREWLKRNGIEPDLLTHMRPIDDWSDDDILKENWLLGCGERPCIVYEDRDVVVNMKKSSLLFSGRPGKLLIGRMAVNVNYRALST